MPACPDTSSLVVPSHTNNVPVTSNKDDCSSGDESRESSLSSSLPAPFLPTPSIDQLWVGDVATGDGNEQPITLFLSYCQADIGWLNTYLIGHTMNSTTIISKCDKPLPFGRKMLKRIQQQTLPNVGRNDHTIAHTMATISQNYHEKYENHIIVFLKDNLKLHQQAKPRSLTQMIRAAQQNGFGCFLKPRDGLSQYHDTATLQHFNLSLYRQDVKTNDNTNFKSPYKNVQDWWDKMGIAIPIPYTTVCYGGSFAVKASRVASISPKMWESIKESLSREDNIEEGHFAERSWSGLLSNPPTESLVEQLRQKQSGINVALSKDGGGQLGALLL